MPLASVRKPKSFACASPADFCRGTAEIGMAAVHGRKKAAKPPPVSPLSYRAWCILFAGNPQAGSENDLVKDAIQRLTLEVYHRRRIRKFNDITGFDLSLHHGDPDFLAVFFHLHISIAGSV